MNKKLIRLTESDLHRIVKESVNKILSEAINELDPRTYASYADKRRAQGQNDKAFKGTQAAANAWNKEYGYNHDGKRQPGSLDNYGMDDYGYNNPYDENGREAYDKYLNDDGNIYGINQEFKDSIGGYRHLSYDPKNDISSEVRFPAKNSFMQFTPRISRGKGEGTIGAEADTDIDVLGDDSMRRGIDVAKQMARGNGKYIKGKGWQ